MSSGTAAAASRRTNPATGRTGGAGQSAGVTQLGGRTREQRPMPEVSFLTVAEVASAMRVSRMTVYRLVHSGTLPAVRVGRSFRVQEQAVTDYLRDAFVQAG